MLIKSLKEEVLQDYKKPSMLVCFPFCDFKCWKDLGIKDNPCHNKNIINDKNHYITPEILYNFYYNNKITEAIILGGLEPLHSKSIDDVISFIKYVRTDLDDYKTDLVIYTGYTENEIKDFIDEIKIYPNIILKVGRFNPNIKAKFDDVLGITLATGNQYGIKIS